jgi:hypothetical protein
MAARMPDPKSLIPVDPVEYARKILLVEPIPVQQEIARALLKPPYRVLSPSAHSVGKAQPVEMMIDTPLGRRPFGSLRVGSLVFGRDGIPIEVLSIHSQGHRPQYRVTLDDGSSTLADADHLWTVLCREHRHKRCRQFGVWETLTTAQIVARGVTQSNGCSVVRNWELPAHGPVQYPRRDVPVPAYTFGVWLGDGTVGSGEITSADPEMVEWLQEENSCQVHVKGSRSDSLASVLRVPKLITGLRLAGVAETRTHQKRVPRRYMENDIGTRLAVLQGLMDTDGTSGNRVASSATFCSTSEGLVDDVIWLVRSLGGKASKQPTAKQAWYTDKQGQRVNGRLAYQATVRLDAFPLFRLERKQSRLPKGPSRHSKRFIAKIEPAGVAEMQCITVDAIDSLYLVNDFIPTHNSWCAAWLANWWFDRYPDQSCVVTTAPTRAHTAQVLWREIRIMRKKAGLPGQFSGRMMPQLYDTEDHFMIGLTAAKGESFTGRHLKHMLFIFDEAVACDPIYWESTRTMFKGDGNHGWFAIANPTDTTSQMYLESRLTNADGSPVWTQFPLSALEHPNIVRQLRGEAPLIPEAVTLEQVEEWIRDFCDPIAETEATATDLLWPPRTSGVNPLTPGRWYRPSPVGEARILGRWPEAGTFGVWSSAAWNAATTPCKACKGQVPITHCARCMARIMRMVPEIGVDVAYHGDDSTAFVVRIGPFALECERHNGWGGPQIVARAKELARKWAAWTTSLRDKKAAPVQNKQIKIKVDSDGMGGLGIVSWAQPGWEEDYSFQGVSAATKANASDRYPNKRSELWFHAVERAKIWELDLSRLPKAELERLRQQAMTPLWDVDAAGRRVVEPKKKTKERMRGSPDEMDALNLAFAEYTSSDPLVLLGEPKKERDVAAERGWYGKPQRDRK